MAKIKLDEQIKFWKDSASRDWQMAELSFKNKRYDYSLFFCHLTLEKELKGLVARKLKKSPPFTHDLAKLAELSGINPSDVQIKNFFVINSFNISGRYDSYKREFYKIADKKYTEKYLLISKQLYRWLEKKYSEK